MKKTLRNIFAFIALTASLAWAGSSDYNDMVITQMKNNGEYVRLSRMYPQASDAELVSIYEERK